MQTQVNTSKVPAEIEEAITYLTGLKERAGRDGLARSALHRAIYDLKRWQDYDDPEDAFRRKMDEATEHVRKAGEVLLTNPDEANSHYLRARDLFYEAEDCALTIFDDEGLRKALNRIDLVNRAWLNL